MPYTIIIQTNAVVRSIVYASLCNWGYLEGDCDPLFTLMFTITNRCKYLGSAVSFRSSVAFDDVMRSLRQSQLRRCSGRQSGEGQSLVLVSVEVVHLHRRGHLRSPHGTVIPYIYTFPKRSSRHPVPSRFVCPSRPLGPTSVLFSR